MKLGVHRFGVNLVVRRDVGGGGGGDGPLGLARRELVAARADRQRGLAR